MGMTRWKTGFAMMAVLTIAACSSMRVTADKYPEAEFDEYQSFAWMSEDGWIRPQDSPEDVSPLVTRRIRDEVVANLVTMGYRQVADPSQADFVVSFTVGARDRIDGDAYPLAYRGPWYWNWYLDEPRLRVYREGTLSIDIFDADTHQPVWHGRASKPVSGSDIDDPGPVIERAVEKILDEFPARTA